MSGHYNKQTWYMSPSFQMFRCSFSVWVWSNHSCFHPVRGLGSAINLATFICILLVFPFQVCVRHLTYTAVLMNPRTLWMSLFLGRRMRIRMCTRALSAQMSARPPRTSTLVDTESRGCVNCPAKRFVLIRASCLWLRFPSRKINCKTWIWTLDLEHWFNRNVMIADALECSATTAGSKSLSLVFLDEVL